MRMEKIEWVEWGQRKEEFRRTTHFGGRLGKGWWDWEGFGEEEEGEISVNWISFFNCECLSDSFLHCFLNKCVVALIVNFLTIS